MTKIKHGRPNKGRINFNIRQFFDNEASGGIFLILVAFCAILIANSSISAKYFLLLKTPFGSLSLLHWINDGLMALFFLLVGLEIKREILEGHLSSWSQRILPGAAAVGGMVVPALIFLSFNYANSETIRGWAIPAATDIAFALGVLSLLGKKIPSSLKVFLAALAIIDDLGAIIIIAVFYTTELNFLALGGATLVIAALITLNRCKVMQLRAYLIPGIVLWLFVFYSGVHATLAGVILALTIPINLVRNLPEAYSLVSPLHRLEHILQKPVIFFIIPIFAFANAGISFADISIDTIMHPLTLGVALGLLVGKVVGVLGATILLFKIGLVELPAGSNWGQMLGVAFLCGIGFTMSLFIGILAFGDPIMQERIKFGILAASLIAGLSGYIILRFIKSKKR